MLRVLVAVLVVVLSTTPVVAATGVQGPPGERVATTVTDGCTGGVDATTANGTTDVSIDALVAPGFAYDRLRNASAVAAAMDEGILVTAPENSVAEGDVAVHRIELSGNATGLMDRLAAQQRGSPTANFQALVETDGINFGYIGPSTCPPEMALNETIDRGALRVVPDRRTDTLYVLVDVDEAVYERDGERSTEKWVLQMHHMKLTLQPSSGLVSREVSARDHYDVERARATFSEAGDDSHLSLDAAPERTVGGRTNVAAGRNLTVDLAFEDGSTMTRTVTVHVHHDEWDPYRQYHATFDLSNVTGGTEVEVIVRDGEAVVGRTTGTVGTASSPTPTTTAPPTTETDTASPTPSTTAPQTETAPGTSESTPGFGAAGAVLALTVAVALHRRRR